MIRLENVSKYYHNESVVTLGLRKINLEMKLGEFIALTGESGSGKSTLLNVISGIDSYDDGELYINNHETSHYDDNDWEDYRRDSIGFIFQNYNLIDSYTVLKNVEVALVIQGIDKKTRKQKAKAIIEKVGLTSHIRHRASKLSGGQKQRLAIARALAKDTRIIVADEPTGNLDSDSGKQILSLLNEVSKDKLVIIVTHNFEQAAPYVTRKIRLYDGEVVEDKELRTTNEVKEDVVEGRKSSKLSQVATVSTFNLLGQPRKSILQLLVSFATVVFVFLVFGAYLAMGNEQNYYSTPNAFNLNDYRERLILTKKDKTPLTEEDYQKISAIRKVDSVIKADQIVDMQINSVSMSFNHFDFNGFIDFNGEYDSDDIIGRLPENENEVLISTFIYDQVLEDYKELLETEQQFRLSSYMFSINTNFKIVGFVQSKDYGTRYIFTNETIDNLNQQVKISFAEYKLEIKDVQGNLITDARPRHFKISSNLTGNQISVPKVLEEYFTSDNSLKIYINNQLMEIKDYYGPVFNPVDLIYVSEEFYENLKINTDDQYTVNLKNYKDADSVIKTLYNMGYYTFSPYNSKPFDIDAIGILFNKIISFVYSFFALFVVYLISYLIFRTIMISKKRDYTILRTIGIKKTSIKQIVSFEIIISFLTSYLLFIISYTIYNRINPKLLEEISENYKFTDYFVLAMINIIIALLISRRFNKLLANKSLLIDLKVGD